jgi:O-antigen/teichoic acid export membrane protein
MNTLFARARDRLLPIVLSQFVGLLCGIGGVRLVSQWVPPATLGSYGIFLTFTTLGLWVVHAGLIKFIVRHWAETTDKNALLRAALRSWARKLVWLAVAAGIAAAAIDYLGGVRGLFIATPLFISAALLSLGVLAQNTVQAARRYWTDFAISVTGSITRTFIPPVLFLISGHALGLYLGFGIHACCFAAVALWTLRAHLRPTPAITHAPTVTPIYDGAFFATLSMIGWVLTGVNRWIVAGFLGETSAGLFTLAGNLAQIAPAMLGAVFMQYFQPGLFSAPHATPSERRALASRVDRIAAVYTLLALAGIAGVHLLTPWLIGTLIDERYRAALAYIAGAGCFSAAVIIGQFYHALLLAGRRERACGPVDLTAAAILILGGLATMKLGGESAFLRWLLITPIIPWVISRSLARRYFLRESSGPEPTETSS